MLRRHVWTTLTTMAAVVALAAACSSNSTSPGTTSSSTAVTTNSIAPQAHGAYEKCLGEHGVPAPNGSPAARAGAAPAGPPPGPPPEGTPETPSPPLGVDQATWDNAISACKSLAPSPPAGNR
jgi:hypothetical protein